MEKNIRNHMISYMKDNGLFSQKQYSFISGRSTVLQLIKILDEWTSEMDKGNYTDVMLFICYVIYTTCKSIQLVIKRGSCSV